MRLMSARVATDNSSTDVNRLPPQGQNAHKHRQKTSEGSVLTGQHTPCTQAHSRMRTLISYDGIQRLFFYYFVLYGQSVCVCVWQPAFVHCVREVA